MTTRYHLALKNLSFVQMHFLFNKVIINNKHGNGNEKKALSRCAGSCEPGSRYRPNECIVGGEKPRGVGILEWGVNER